MELKIGIQKNWFQKGCITFNKITLGCSKQGQFHNNSVRHLSPLKKADICLHILFKMAFLIEISQNAS